MCHRSAHVPLIAALAFRGLPLAAQTPDGVARPDSGQRSNAPRAVVTHAEQASGRPMAMVTDRTTQLQFTIGELASYPVPDDPPGERIFRDGDPDVEPPALLRGRGPAVPGPEVSPDQVCAFEFVVDESGNVRHIQMFSMSNRLDHRMMMAAIKAWKFRPATRRGSPVRFRTRVWVAD